MTDSDAKRAFEDGPIEGVIVQDFEPYDDERGWLAEIFRSDEIDADLMPVMGYVSMTKPGVARGPHEHVTQTDIFVFAGPGTFKVYLWDNREESPTFNSRQTFLAGVDERRVVVIPPGVVHAYAVVSDEAGLVFNLPNQLYAGQGKKEKVDEIRWEECDERESPFTLD